MFASLVASSQQNICEKRWIVFNSMSYTKMGEGIYECIGHRIYWVDRWVATMHTKSGKRWIHKYVHVHFQWMQNTILKKWLRGAMQWQIIIALWHWFRRFLDCTQVDNNCDSHRKWLEPVDLFLVFFVFFSRAARVSKHLRAHFLRTFTHIASHLMAVNNTKLNIITPCTSHRPSIQNSILD